MSIAVTEIVSGGGRVSCSVGSGLAAAWEAYREKENRERMRKPAMDWPSKLERTLLSKLEFLNSLWGLGTEEE
jgi:hypothetical protein